MVPTSRKKCHRGSSKPGASGTPSAFEKEILIGIQAAERRELSGQGYRDR